MADKMSNTRFSIYFNTNDQRHISAAEILRSKGRKKAQYLTDAILFYDSIMTGSYKEKYITACLSEMENPQNRQAPADLTPEATGAIMGSLGAFKNKP